ncbi:MAG TPA: hypothetical protein ENJ68_00385 [Devosia sp.]|nr:hypothetical protein [Devosia sp.]
MKKTIATTLSVSLAASLAALTLAVAGTSAVQARSITNLVPAAQLRAFCATRPANAHVSVRFTRANGSVVTGTVECERVSGGRGGSLSRLDDNGNHDNGMGEGREGREGYEANEGNESLSHEANEGYEGGSDR